MESRTYLDQRYIITLSFIDVYRFLKYTLISVTRDYTQNILFNKSEEKAYNG